MKKLLSLAFLLNLAACGSNSPNDSAGTEAGPHPLDDLYLVNAPEGAIEVGALRELADGSEVVVRGDVQEFAPVAGKAILSLYDHELPSCDENPDDQCPTPWDFCCVQPTMIAENSAMVEFRMDGEIVAANLGGFHGIDHLSDVVVAGTLHLDEAGNARIEATGLHVE